MLKLKSDSEFNKTVRCCWKFSKRLDCALFPLLDSTLLRNPLMPCAKFRFRLLPTFLVQPGFTEAFAKAVLDLQSMLIKPIQRYIKRQVEREIFNVVLA